MQRKNLDRTKFILYVQGNRYFPRININIGNLARKLIFNFLALSNWHRKLKRNNYEGSRTNVLGFRNYPEHNIIVGNRATKRISTSI